MFVKLLTVDLLIPGCSSLKEKRFVLSSLKSRLRGRFNVSVAEVGSLDHRQMAELGIALVANDGRFVESCLDRIVDYVRQDRTASLIDYEVEIF